MTTDCSGYQKSSSQTFRIDLSIVGEKVPTLADIEAMIVAKYMDIYNFNKTRVAEKLGITRKTLLSMCNKYNITPRSKT